MGAKTVIKVDWQQNNLAAAAVHVDPNPEECLALAEKAEAMNEHEWAQYWLDQAVREEAKLEVGV